MNILDYKVFTNCMFHLKYRTRAIIGRSRFEAALVYKPRILGFKNGKNYVLTTYNSFFIKFQYRTHAIISRGLPKIRGL